MFVTLGGSKYDAWVKKGQEFGLTGDRLMVWVDSMLEHSTLDPRRPKSIVVVGREYFGSGRTTQSWIVLVDGLIVNAGRAQCYGMHFQYLAMKQWMEHLEVKVDKENPSPWHICEILHINYAVEMTRVGRAGDLYGS